MGEQYRTIHRDILDTREGEEVSRDFEDAPSAATTIRIIANIAGTALRGVEEIEELKESLDRTIDDAIKRREQEDKGVLK